MSSKIFKQLLAGVYKKNKLQVVESFIKFPLVWFGTVS